MESEDKQIRQKLGDKVETCEWFELLGMEVERGLG
jgi:hypothetical protein